MARMVISSARDWGAYCTAEKDNLKTSGSDRHLRCSPAPEVLERAADFPISSEILKREDGKGPPLLWGRRTPSGRRQYVMMCVNIITGLCLLGIWAVPTVSVSHHNIAF